MRIPQRARTIILVVGLCVAADQITKDIARTHLATAPPMHLLNDVFRLHYTENTGAFLGFGASLPEPARFWSFTVLVGGVLIGMLAFVWKNRQMSAVSTIGGAAVVAGGFSNLVDRILNDGAVVDFMNIGLGSLRTGIFNVADVAIMAGIGALFVGGLFLDDTGKDVQPDTPSETGPDQP